MVQEDLTAYNQTTTTMPSEPKTRNLRGETKRKEKDRTDMTFVVMWSTIHGRGLFTRKDFEKGEVVIYYTGEASCNLV